MPPVAQLPNKDGLLIQSSVLLSNYYVPGTAPGPEYTEMNFARGPAPIFIGETVNNLMYDVMLSYEECFEEN